MISAALLSFALILGVIPEACLSDAVVPPCVLQHDCGGSSGQFAEAGEAGELLQGGNAGSLQVLTSGAGGMAPIEDGVGGATPVDEAGAAGAPNHGGTGGTGGSLVGSGGCGNCALYPAELPNPCGSDAYSTSISVGGGVGHYQWQVTGTTGSSWMVTANSNSTDGSHATLSGNPSGAGDLTVTVTDGLGYTKQQQYSIAPRSACYFAYVAPDANGPKLALRDPLLAIDATGKLIDNQGVYDFQFSPDGRFLAYRYGQSPTHPSGVHLSLLDLSTMQDQALPFNTVTAYAWSPDSAVLAASLTASGGVSQLGGVRITPAAGGAQLSFLIPVVAANPVESSLLWVDNGFVSFFSTATLDMGAPPSGFSATLYASLGAAGFDAPVPITDMFYKPGFVATPAPGGLFVTSPNDDFSAYNSVSIDNAFEEDHETNFIDPAGAFSAAIANKALQLFPASDSSTLFEASSSNPASDCPKLLTWARGRERIACVAHVSQAATSWGELRIFDAGSATPLEIVPAAVKGSCLKDAAGVPLAGQCSLSEYDYDESTSIAQPRLLSASGRWLAFVTGAQSGVAGYIHWADLDASPMTLSRKVPANSTTNGSPVALAFSPSERYLLHQNGNRLVAHLLSGDANDPGNDIELNLSAPATAGCAEDFTTGSTRWCGGAGGSPSFTWSPDSASDVIAYRKLDQLVVVEVKPAPDRYPLAAPVCDATCSGQYGFQPPRP